MSWRRGQTATYSPKVSPTIAAFLSHLGWAAQPWVTEGRKPSVCKLIFTLASCPPTDSNSNWDWNSNWLTNKLNPSVAPGYIIVWHPLASCGCTHLQRIQHVHRSSGNSHTFDWMHLFRCSPTYLYRCISWLTARSRVNMLQKKRMKKKDFNNIQKK